MTHYPPYRPSRMAVINAPAADTEYNLNGTAVTIDPVSGNAETAQDVRLDRGVRKFSLRARNSGAVLKYSWFDGQLDDDDGVYVTVPAGAAGVEDGILVGREGYGEKRNIYFSVSVACRVEVVVWHNW